MKWCINKIINGFKLIEKSKRKGYWLAEHNCGRIYEFRTTQINKQKFCKGCIENYHLNNKGFNHKSWKGFGELSSDLFTTIKLSARDRGLNFNLEIEYLWNLFLNQDKKCALSGLDIQLNEKCSDKKFKTATLDRIDSSIGYTKGNVQWLHRDINKMKNNFPEEYFFKLCELVYKKNGISDFNIKLGSFYKNGGFNHISELDDKQKKFTEFKIYVFSKYPNLDSFEWVQYSPYSFEDELNFSIKIDSLIVNLSFMNDKELVEITKDIKECLKHFDNDFYKSQFGDHARVVVSRSGVNVEEYEHD